MKLTKKALALILAAALLLGSVAVGVFADGYPAYVQESGVYNYATNPYKEWFTEKVYQLKDGNFVELTKTLNQETGKYEVNADYDAILKVEVYFRTNFATAGMAIVAAYDSAAFIPLKNDMTSTFVYGKSTTKSTETLVFPDEEGTDPPASDADPANYYFDAFTGKNSSVTGTTYGATKSSLIPKEWQGTGTAEGNFRKNTMNCYKIVTSFDGDRSAGGWAPLYDGTEDVLVASYYIKAKSESAIKDLDATSFDIVIPDISIKSTAYPNGGTNVMNCFPSAYTYNGKEEGSLVENEYAFANAVNSQAIGTTEKNAVTDIYLENNTQVKYDRVVDNTGAQIAVKFGAEAPQPTLDYTALNTAVTAAKATYDAGNDAPAWTADTWATFAAAYDAAKAMLDGQTATTQADIDDTADALDTAFSGLDEYVAPIDYSALQDAVDAAQATYEAGNDAPAYTADTWATFAAAYDAAKAMLDGQTATAQQDVADTADALTTAFEGLEEYVAPIDYTDLNTAVTAAKATYDAGNDAPAWTADTWTTFAAAYDAAKAMLDGQTATSQQDVADTAAALTTAFGALEEYVAPIDYSALQDAVNAAQATYEAGNDAPAWTADTWATFAAAYDAAKAMLDGQTATAQQDVADTADALTTAFEGLEEYVAPLDYTALANAVNDAKATYDAGNDPKVYTSSSWTNFTNAYETGKAMLDAQSAADQDAINNAASAVAGAANALVPVGNKGDLQIAYDDASALNPADYTASSWTAANLADALTAAAAVLADTDAVQKDIDDAKAAIDNATAVLVDLGDKTTLNALIATANQAITDEAKYTEESFTEADLANAVAAANIVALSDDVDQAAVDAAAAALQAALDKLVTVVVDKTALGQALEAAAAAIANEDAYTPNSFAEADLVNAIVNPTAVYNNADATQDAVDAAAKAVNDALALLKAKADKRALKDAIDTDPVYTAETATTATWNAYQNAFTTANGVYNDANADQQTVNEAKEALVNAINALEPREACNYADLDALIEDYDDETLDSEIYTAASWADYESAINDGKNVARDMLKDDDGVNQGNINAAVNAINNAIDNLVTRRSLLDVTELEALIAEFNSYNEANYTEASWALYAQAVVNGEGTLADLTIDDQAEINDACDEIKDARDALVALGNKQALQDLYDANKDTAADPYTADSFAALTAALSDARDVLNNSQATQGDIDGAYNALLAAVNGLERKVDKTALKAQIDRQPNIEENLATDASWANYAAALAAAEAVYADADATQAQVDAAAEALKYANNDLTLRGLCQYDYLDEALALTPAEPESAYNPTTWANYIAAKTAAEAVARDLIDTKDGQNQKLINDAASALSRAYKALKINGSSIYKVEAAFDTYYTAHKMPYTFYVRGEATKIQILYAQGGTSTYTRDHAAITIVSYDAEGNVVDRTMTTPAYETWTVSLNLPFGNYEARAKYGTVWENDNFAFPVNRAVYKPASDFNAIVDGNKTKTLNVTAEGKQTFEVVTPKDVEKVQFVFANGTTSTYTTTKAVENGDQLVWTIARKVHKTDAGEVTLRVKTMQGWQVVDCDPIVISFE